MKKMLFIAMLCAATAMIAVPAFADNGSVAPTTGPGGNGSGSAGSGAGGPGGGGAGNGERFDEMKAKILAKMAEHQACVQAATSMEALKACRPKGGGEGGGHRFGGGGGFGGGRGGQQGGANNSAPAQ